MITTVGQLLVNEALPPDMRDYGRTVDKKSMAELATKVAEQHPDKYKDVMYKLQSTGADVAHITGSSFRLSDLELSPAAKQKMDAIRARVVALVNDDTLNDDQRADSIRDVVLGNVNDIEDTIYKDGLASGNQLALQAHSGSRGSKSDLRAISAGEFMVADHRDRVIPIPILHGYASGLSPAEFWASSYGTRKGQAATKLLIADAGFLAKRMAQAAHRQVVTEGDCGTTGGIPVPADDADNAGALLAADYGDFKAGTPIDAAIMRQLGDQRILVRSPITCHARAGVCARCVGIRESGSLPDIGDAVGLTAAQAVAERVSQGTLGSKHSGGRASKDTSAARVTGIPLLNQFIDVPASFRDGSTLAEAAGAVQSIEAAPQGGSTVRVGGVDHHVPSGFAVTVKPGQSVYAGMPLSEGWQNPADVARLRGIGAARLGFITGYRDALKASGVKANRRNLELLSRGLINHVRVTELDGVDGLPDDILEYGALEADYRPRYGFRQQPVGKSVGMYLEKPALYHTIGTEITPDVAKELGEYGVKDVVVHTDPPSFEPLAVRSMETSMRSPDWQVRFGGSYLRTGLLEAAHRGRSSDQHGTSYVPALLQGVEFGKDLKTKGTY